LARRWICSGSTVNVEVGLTLLTVFAAGVLGGGIATDITVIVVLAAIALILIAAYNGLRNLLYFCDATSSRKVSRES
jgi:hypothetical protein